MSRSWFGRKTPAASLPTPQAAPAPASEIEAAQADVVRALAASVTDVHDGDWETRDWLRIVANVEAFWDRADTPTSSLAFSIAQRPGGPLEKLSFRLSSAARASLAQLAQAMHTREQAWWTVCEITVERNGHFAFAFSYDAPYRLSGNLHDTRFKDYLARYQADTGATP